MALYPLATWNPIIGHPGLQFVPRATMRGVLHSTEVPGLYTPRFDGSYFGGASPPHFTVDAIGVHQHIDTGLASYAIENRTGGVETNRQGCIQIEIMGRAVEAPDWDADTLTVLAALMRWIENVCGVQARPWDHFHTYPPEDGIRLNGQEPWRIPFDVWPTVDCWVGHQHCPENVHGDPGKIRLDRLFPTAATTTAVVPVHGFTDFEEGQMRKALVGSGPPNQFAIANPRWDPGFDRPPNVIGVVPNGLVQLRSQIGAHIEGNDVVLDIVMVDTTGAILAPFDVHVTVS